MKVAIMAVSLAFTASAACAASSPPPTTSAAAGPTAVTSAAANPAPAASAAASGLGRIEFPISCGSQARVHFVEGVLALHSFFYDHARDEFQAASRAEPECTLAYWGEAMSWDETLWDWQDSAAGRIALAKATALRKALSPKESAFIEAASALFGAEGDGTDLRARVRAYEAALRRMHERWPDDDEMAAFYALAHMSASDPAQPSRRVNIEAGAIALEVLRHNPQHPGALHYAIHAFDDPDHAVLALPAARTYAQIAPEAFHARHMPAHIFVQLGAWDEAAAACESAWEVSLKWIARRSQSRGEADLHSLSWLAPIYAQMGQRAKADKVLDTFGRIVTEGGFGALVYIPAALAVTRDTQRWGRMEGLLAPVTGALSAIDARWEKSKGVDARPLPARVRAMLAQARAITAARRGDGDGARKYAAELKAEHAREATMAPHSVDAARKGEQRWSELLVDSEIAIATGQIPAAEAALRAALPLEETIAKADGATPWRISSYERLGELALSAGRNQEAADDFAGALERVPARSSALAGAATAADRLGAAARADDLRRALAHNRAHADAETTAPSAPSTTHSTIRREF